MRMPSQAFFVSGANAFAHGAVINPFTWAGSTRSLQNFSIASEAPSLLQFDVHGIMSNPALSSSSVDHPLNWAVKRFAAVAMSAARAAESPTSRSIANAPL